MTGTDSTTESLPTVEFRAGPGLDATAIIPRIRDDRSAARLWAAVTFGVTAVMAFIGLAHREMWYDEYATAYAVLLPWHQFVTLIQHRDLVHMAYYLIMRPIAAVFGSSPLVLRLPSLLAMAGTSAVIVHLGRRMFDLTTGVCAAIVFALIPAVSRYGEEARSYAFLTFVATLSFVLLLRVADRPTRARWTLYAISLLFIGLFNLLALLVFPAQLVLFRDRIRRERTDIGTRPMVVITVVLAIALLPMLVVSGGQDAQIGWIGADTWTTPLGYVSRLVMSFALSIVLLLAGATVVLAARTRRRWPSGLTVVLWWALFPPTVILLASLIKPLYVPRYLIYTVPAWAFLGGMAASMALAAVGRRGLPVSAGVIAVSIMLVAAASYGGQVVARKSPAVTEPDFRATSAVIRAQMRPGDTVVYADLGGYGYNRLATTYELGSRYDTLRDVLVSAPPSRSGSFEATEYPDFASHLGGLGRVWLVDSFLTASPVSTYLDAHYRRVETATFSGARVSLYVPKASQRIN